MLVRAKEKRVDLDDILSQVDDIANEKQEHFVVFTLDSNRKVINRRIVFMGTVDTVIAHSREIYAGALEDRAVSIVVVHNHPSGNPTPSGPDKEITQQLAAAGQLLAIKLEDHIVVAGDEFVSFREEGLL